MQTKILFLIVCSAYAQMNMPEDARLNFTELAVKYGQRSEEFDIVTEDGYILKLFHIIGYRKRPVLLVHGLLDSSDGFIIRGNLSLAVNLAKNGYDVWAINHRGNRYSRRHITLNPDTDAAFWNFYVNEFGSRDLPATIDFILQKTGRKISIIGYSQGTTNTLVLGATRPEYNDKIKVFIALAPISFLHNAESHMSTFIKLAPDINRGLRQSGLEEIVGYNSPMKNFIDRLCTMKGVGYRVCIEGFAFQLAGIDSQQFEPEFLPVWLGHFPAGSSRMNLNHFAQIGNRKRFGYYDYGPKKNMVLYGSRIPPDFDLSKITMNVALLVADNDRMSTLEDVELLRRRLPNVVEYRKMNYNAFNHLDYVWGRTTYSIVLPEVLDILAKYNGCSKRCPTRLYLPIDKLITAGEV